MKNKLFLEILDNQTFVRNKINKLDSLYNNRSKQEHIS